MIRKWWAKITKKSDEAGQFPIQQVSYLGRVADAVILFPYGMHANLPVDQLGLLIDKTGRVFMGTSAVGRIAVEEGEVVFYHPGTKSKTHYKASGDIDIDSKAGGGNINITAKDVNITADNVNVDATTTNLGTGGAAIARVGDQVQIGAGVGTIISGGANTSI